ncbi:hypothetical protein J437_LFUL002397 [Ladona fulva]|uniref:ATP-dependent DNA helicase n=1 Tax=Ladona fulva TaxID=123851 RepID=A0A8K0NZU6_LADFU|nr:hypothetical protein J437_LFUL002397 [Ladona fulva]
MMQREKEMAGECGQVVPVVNMVLKRDRRSDPRRFNTPTGNETAMIFVNDDGETPFERDIRIYPINPQDASKPFINLNILSRNLDPMTYVLLFPYGEPGWQPKRQYDSYDIENYKMQQFASMSTCTSLRAVKYIYKYVYTGHDCSDLFVQSGADGDEVTNFVNGRYVSVIEEMWRILENPRHEKWLSVIRLPVHLPNQQAVCFEEGQESQAFLGAELNDSDSVAREYTYTEIPYHYVNSNGKWKIRKKEHKIVPRMYTVSIQDKEHIEWDKCLEEAVIFQMPAQMRQMFAFIMLYCIPQNCRALWDKFKDDMVIDYLQCNSMARNYNLALNDIICLLKGHQKCCSDFTLPMPVGVFNDIDNDYNHDLEREEADRIIPKLNSEQKCGFERIKRAVEINDHEKCFFFDGPGGSGKTYRNHFLSFLPFATTGIAATNLRGGLTVHKGFGLSVILNETSISYIKRNSNEADKLRKACILIVDEITMLTKEGLRCIDTLLRELMGNGNHLEERQTLLVVANGNRVTIMEACIKQSQLWKLFQTIPLSVIMRSVGQIELNNWLLSIGATSKYLLT